MTHGPLTAAYTIDIDASALDIWNVLTKTRYIEQWDDVPETFQDEALALGAVLEWPGFARLTVTRFEPASYLKLAYHHPGWPAGVAGIDYQYQIDCQAAASRLAIRVGDWAKAPDGNGDDHHAASVEFVRTACLKIKAIVERG